MIVSLLICALQLSVSPQQKAVSDIFAGPEHGFSDRQAHAEVTRFDDRLEIELVGCLRADEEIRCKGSADDPLKIFLGDVAEIFVQPDKSHPTAYYHFAVNPAGVLYQARGRDATWRAHVPVKVESVVADGVWRARFVLPDGAMDGAKVTSGVRWGMEMAMLGVSWNGLKDLHDFGRYGDIVFDNSVTRARIEKLVKGEDGQIRVTYVISPEQTVREIGHKGRHVYDCDLVSHGGAIASFLREEGRDVRWFTLDRYYYPTHGAELAYALKGFVRARFSLRRIADNLVVWSEERGPTGKIAPGDLVPGDYAFEADDGQHRTAISLTVVDLSALKTRSHMYLIPRSDDMAERNKGRLCYEAERYPDPQMFVKRYRERKAKGLDETLAIHLGHFENPEKALKYAEACDVLEGGVSYCSYAPDLLPAQPEAISLVEAAANGKPFVWWLGASVPLSGECRTADELVTAIRYSILRGAAGNVLHNGHGGVPKDRVRVWDVMNNAEAEVSGWYARWKDGSDVPNAVTKTGRNVRVGARRLTDGTFLAIAVNLGFLSESFTLRLPGRSPFVFTLPGCGSAVLEY